MKHHLTLSNTDVADVREFAAGDTLFAEGDAADHAYVIQEGLVEITRRIGAADVVIVSRGSGDLIGELSLIDDAPRGATARALKPTKVLVLPRDRFEQFLHTAAPEVRHMLEHFVGIIRQLTESNLRLTMGLR